MAVFVTTGGKKTKRTNSRFGGETAYRQHADDEKSHVCNARRRADNHFVATVLQDSDLDAEVAEACGNICPCTLEVKPINGVVRAGNVSLVYVGGKILAAHCG
jgi:hypothetical protein